MPVRNIDPNAIGQDEHWEGNSAAFLCPSCNKVFIVSALMHVGPKGEMGGYRKCPKCHQSIGRVKGGKQSGGSASIEWSE